MPANLPAEGEPSFLYNPILSFNFLTSCSVSLLDNDVASSDLFLVIVTLVGPFVTLYLSPYLSFNPLTSSEGFATLGILSSLPFISSTFTSATDIFLNFGFSLSPSLPVLGSNFLNAPPSLLCVTLPFLPYLPNFK